MTVYLLTGSSGAGKSTTDRNLRLRAFGEFVTGDTQLYSDNLMFVGRMLYSNGSAVLRLSGGDSTSPSMLVDLVDYDINLFYEMAILPTNVLVSLSEVAEVIMLNLEEDPAVIVERNTLRGHRSCAKIDLSNLDVYPGEKIGFHAYRPLYKNWIARRDQFCDDHGIRVLHLCNLDLLERCRVIEEMIGITPLYDKILYDFSGTLQEVYSRFADGGDHVRV